MRQLCSEELTSNNALKACNLKSTLKSIDQSRCNSMAISRASAATVVNGNYAFSVNLFWLASSR